jgi:hypothetical protein
LIFSIHNLCLIINLFLRIMNFVFPGFKPPSQPSPRGEGVFPFPPWGK